MNRILIIGCGGSGKSVLAVKLGKILDMPVIHLDYHFWKPGWTPTPKDDWKSMVDQLVSRERWIVDGNFAGTLEKRVKVCDTVIYLDFPVALCLWRAVRRWLRFKKESRPDMAQGCSEKFDPAFMIWIWNFRRKTKPRILEVLKEYENSRKIIMLKNRKEFKKFLYSVRQSENIS